ncbi:MAG: hypothetical protein EAZ61_10855 [Oscillatoriales cyanobacterium]|nr:MAG: hypothetical protein EAZ61_10855 [Oscillatoriales cyanobacterium]
MLTEKNITIQETGLLLITSIVSLFAYGYQFPSENNLVELPSIYAKLDPNLYLRDFYVQAQLEPGVRFFFDHAIVLVSRITQSLPIAYFLCYSLAFTSFVFGVYQLTRRMSESRLAAGIAVLLCLRGINVTLSEVDLFRTEPIPAIFSMSITIWGVYFALARSWIKSYFCFGLAVLLQFLVGLLPGLLVLPILLWETLRNQTLKRAMVSIGLPLGIFSSFIAVVYVPLTLNSLLSKVQLSSAEFIHLYATIRHPHHILPSYWHVGEFLCFTLGGLLCLCNTQQLKPHDRNALLTIVAGSFLSLLLTYIFVEIYPNELIVKLQLGRTTPFLALALLIGISCLATELFQARRYVLAIATAAAPCLASGYVLVIVIGVLVILERRNNIPQRVSQLISYFLIAILAIDQYQVEVSDDANLLKSVVFNGLLLIAVLLPWWQSVNSWTVLKRYSAAQINAIIPVTLTLSLIVMGLGINQQLLPQKFQFIFNEQLPIVKEYSEDVDILSLRLQDAIPNDSLVLIPPSRYSFRALSKKSVVFDFKSFPYTDWGIQEWGKRFKLLVGDVSRRPNLDRLDEPYCQLNESDLIAIAQSFQATHILSTASCHPNFQRVLVDQEGEWQLHQL